ncbi:MAG: alpha-2-macroglobulin, partial [Myxococcales bacterium]|nr:alpha-2-macroglobulin [Myxococcales bacterium]
MKRRASIALAGLVVALAAAQGCHRHDAPPLGLVVGKAGPIEFPSGDEDWSERMPLPASSSPATLKVDLALHVTSPELDDKRHFQNKGQVVRIGFNEPVVDMADVAKAKKKAPNIVITPPVPGHTVWSYASEVEFRAEKPFDPDTEYTLEIPELTSPTGKKLEGGFKATFKADPIVEVAGKTIYYVPKPGRARPIAMSPSDDSLLGGVQAVTIVYDQPIDLGLASKLVTVTKPGKDKKPAVKVPVVLSHPPRNAFEGQKIDPRFVLLLQPSPLLPSSEQITVEAKSQNEEDEARSQDYRIAEATKLVDITCNGSDCEAKDRWVRGGQDTSLRVRFSNPLGLGYSSGNKHVHVSPVPKNLYVSGWDDLSISASFAPSTTYSIQAEGMRDQYGGTVPPVAFTFVSRPLPASATMSEGVALLDEPATRSFPVTTRNVEKGELALWALPKGDVAAYAKALKDTRAWTSPSGEPTVVTFAPPPKRDVNVETILDLGSKLERGRAYVAQVRIAKAADGAVASSYPAGSPASQPSMAVVFATGKDALAAHVHQAGEKSVVQVFRLGSGEPVSGARVSIGTASGNTDAGGSVLLASNAAAAGDDPVLAVSAGDAELLMPLDGTSIASRSLFPELSVGEDGADAHPATDAVGMLVTDRGVYRPGSKMSVKGFVRSVHDATISMLPNAKVRLRVVDPVGTDVADDVLVTNARGAVNKDVSFAKNAHTGRFVLRLELDDGKHTLLASDMVRVADFETPRFKVDVEPAPAASVPTAPPTVKARIVGRYLFGAPMGGAHATWVLKKSRVPVKGGPLAEAGLSFGRDYNWWEDAPTTEAFRPVTGEGTLGEDGALPVDAVTGPLADGPTELVLEADVTDASNRHVSGQLRTVQDPFAHHAGLELSRRFGDAGQPLRVALGAVDASGNVAPGTKVTARLERLTWTRAAEKAESGATVEHWKYVAKKEAECDVVSGDKPVSCDLPVPHGGDFRVVARVDDRDDSSTSFWAYGGWVAGVREAVPSQGKKVPLVLDKARYKGGETAKLLVQSPFAKATALVTYEQGGIVRHETKRIEGPSGTFDVPVSAANAPWLHAAVTLLPIGQSEADFRVGVVRIPVGAEDAKLDVRVTSS